MFGKGRINITLDRTYFNPGDIISGSITLTLKKPVEARSISVSMIGEYRSRHSSIGMGGKGMSTTRERYRIYDFKQELDGEREYTSGQEYNFEIKVPADILSMSPRLPELDGAVGQGLKIVQTAAILTGAMRRIQTKWYLLAKLDISGGMDIRKKADITIG
jgi:hypothetical protein